MICEKIGNRVLLKQNYVTPLSLEYVLDKHVFYVAFWASFYQHLKMNYCSEHVNKDDDLNHLRSPSVSVYRKIDCFFSSLFRLKSKKTSKHRMTGPLWTNHRWPMDSLHKGPVMWKMHPCHYVQLIKILLENMGLDKSATIGVPQWHEDLAPNEFFLVPSDKF